MSYILNLPSTRVNNNGMSTIKSMSFFLLFTGIILITVGYVKSENINKPPRVEYRYVSRSFQDQQMVDIPINSTFSEMFEKRDPLSQLNKYIDIYKPSVLSEK